MTDQKCGFISVIGLPNAGKSTLINTMVGSKVSIVSRKVQTTRSRILGIALHDKAQLVLIDTPGIFKPRKTLEKAMVSAALSSLEGADCVLHIVDAAARDPLSANQSIQNTLKGSKNVILVLNKVDLIDKTKLLKMTQAFNNSFPYEATFMLSALKGSGVKDLAKDLTQFIPDGEWMFPEDQITDMPMRLMAAEITREKIYDQLHQELPYSIFVKTEDWERFDNGSVKISQLVYVEQDSQKGIILGKGGAKIKRIGKDARVDLEDILDCPVHLSIFVRVQKNWAEQAENYEMFGLDIPH